MIKNDLLRNVLPFIAMAIFAGVLVGCQKEELLYSCDSKINSWVIDHKDIYSDISRDELAKIEHDKQKGLFASFSPEQKVKIYLNKYQYLMGLNTLSEKEKEYLTVLFQKLSPSIYSSEEERIKFVEFSENWSYEVVDKFGWDPIDVYRYTHTWLMNEEFEQWYKVRKSQKNLKSTKSECDCYYSFFGCPGLGICHSSSCSVVYDCGVFGSTGCDGTCD